MGPIRNGWVPLVFGGFGAYQRERKKANSGSKGEERYESGREKVYRREAVLLDEDWKAYRTRSAGRGAE